jgi:hypothetical protein
LTVTDGAYLFGQTQPTVPTDDLAKWAVNVPATPVVILDWTHRVARKGVRQGTPGKA